MGHRSIETWNAILNMGGKALGVNTALIDTSIFTFAKTDDSLLSIIFHSLFLQRPNMRPDFTGI